MKKRGFLAKLHILLLASVVALVPGTRAFASPESERLEYNKTLPVDSNAIENWPQGPVISAYSAILMDAETGTVLYDKNSRVRMYPASTTKMMTSLLAMEKKDANLNDLIEISARAVDLPWDASTIDLVAGDKITLEEALYAILVCSANEASNAVAEYVSGDIDAFVELMNQKALELGCTDTTFKDAHGYCVDGHMTTAHDLALIMREFAKNELLCKMARTPAYHWYPTEYQAQDIAYGSHNYFLRGYYNCEGLVASKTGFTDESRQVLATCAERGGMRLIAVVMQDELPYQYEDTLALFDYGFNNFEKVYVSEKETKYSVTDDDFFLSDSSVFGTSSALFTIDKTACVIVPKTAGFDALSSSLSYSDKEGDHIATVYYSYHGVPLGSADILLSSVKQDSFVFDATEPEIADPIEQKEEEPTFIYVNYIIYGIGILFVIVFVTALLVKLITNTHFAGQKHKRRRKRKPSSHYLDL